MRNQIGGMSELELRRFIGRVTREVVAETPRLQDLDGWSDQIANNGQTFASAPLSLTTSDQTIAGLEVTLLNAGSYLIIGNIESSLTTSTGNTGAIFPTTGTNVDRGFDSWTSPSRITANDGSETAVGNESETDSLLAQFTGNNYPPSALVTGIVFVFEGWTDTGGEQWNTQPYIGGDYVGTLIDTSTTNNSASVENHGGTTYNWGATITGEDLNTSGNGIAIYGTGGAATTDWLVDYVNGTIYFSNLHDTVISTLYVDSVAQTGTVSQATGAGQTVVGSRIWYVETAGSNIPVALKAKKTYSITAPTVTVNSNLIVIRIA